MVQSRVTDPEGGVEAEAEVVAEVIAVVVVVEGVEVVDEEGVGGTETVITIVTNRMPMDG